MGLLGFGRDEWFNLCKETEAGAHPRDVISCQGIGKDLQQLVQILHLISELCQQKVGQLLTKTGLLFS